MQSQIGLAGSSMSSSNLIDENIFCYLPNKAAMLTTQPFRDICFMPLFMNRSKHPLIGKIEIIRVAHFSCDKNACFIWAVLSLLYWAGIKFSLFEPQAF